MTVTVTIIPEYKQQPETLFINFIERKYNDIKDATHSQAEKCKYTTITLDGELTTRVFFPDYPSAVKWCKTYIRESDYIVKVDDNTGLTNNQENWYANVIKTKATLLVDEFPDTYLQCLYCKQAFIKDPKHPNKRKFCNETHRSNYGSRLYRENKKKKSQQNLDN